MGDQEKKRPLLIMFDAISDDDDGEIYDMAVMGGIWKELILAAKKLPDDDFSDFTPPTKKVKENAIINSSLSSISENKNSNSNNDNRSNEKRNQNKSHRDRDKERGSSSSKKDRDKHKSSSREKERSISSSSKEKERERHKSKSKEKERDKKSTSKEKETEKHKSSSKEKHTSSRKDKERDKKSTSKDRESEKNNSSSKDKERDKRNKSVDRENEKERSRSVNRENKKEKYEESKIYSELDSESIIKIEEKINYEKKDTIRNSSKERSPDRSQGSNKDKSQDKCKETSNTIEESEVNCNIIEKSGNTEDNSVIKVCPEDIKCNKNIVNYMSSKSTKGEKIFNSISVSIGPLTSTQKSTPERRKPKERLTVEEKVFQRELEAALNISKMDVTADTESVKLEENEVEFEKSIDHENKSSSEVKSEEMKVPKLILKVKTDQIINKIIDKIEINNDNKIYHEPEETSLKEDIPVYEIKKVENYQVFKAENDNIQTIKDEKTKIISDNISNTTNNAETHSVEILSASNKSKPLSKDAKIKLTDKIDFMYENPKPSTSTGFISGKRQRKTVVFKEDSDSEGGDFSVQSDSEDSNFEISPIKKSKDESKTSISKPDKTGTKKMGNKGNKNNDKKEKKKTKRISPRTRRNRNPIIVGSDSDSEEFKNLTMDTLKSNKVENDVSGDTKDDMKENDQSNGKLTATGRNKIPQVKRSQKKNDDDNDESDEDFDCDSDDSEFKSSPKKKAKPISKEKKNYTLVEKKESNEKSITVLNTKNLPSNRDKVNSILKPTGNSTKLINTNKLADTSTRSIGMTKSAAPLKSFTPVITKSVLASTPARVSTGLVKTPFRSPILNTSPNTSSSIFRSTTPEVRSIGLRIGLSRSTGFKPLHPNLKK